MKHPLRRVPRDNPLPKRGWGSFLLSAFVIALVFHIIAGLTSAAVTAHGHSAAPEMRAQHDSMSTISGQWQDCKSRLEGGDFRGAGTALSRIQKATDTLTEFRPHKNRERIEDFTQQVDDFKKKLSALGMAIREKDKGRIETLSLAIDNSCLQCHSAFR